MPTVSHAISMIDTAYRFVTIDELALRLCRNRFTLYHWLKAAPERLPRVTRIHGRVLFLESDVRAFFEAFGVASAPQSTSSTAAVVHAPKPVRRRGRPCKADEVAARRATLGATGGAA